MPGLCTAADAVLDQLQTAESLPDLDQLGALAADSWPAAEPVIMGALHGTDSELTTS